MLYNKGMAQLLIKCIASHLDTWTLSLIAKSDLKNYYLRSTIGHVIDVENDGYYRNPLEPNGKTGFNTKVFCLCLVDGKKEDFLYLLDTFDDVPDRLPPYVFENFINTKITDQTKSSTLNNMFLEDREEYIKNNDFSDKEIYNFLLDNKIHRSFRRYVVKNNYKPGEVYQLKSINDLIIDEVF